MEKILTDINPDSPEFMVMMVYHYRSTENYRQLQLYMQSQSDERAKEAALLLAGQIEEGAFAYSTYTDRHFLNETLLALYLKASRTNFFVASEELEENAKAVLEWRDAA